MSSVHSASALARALPYVLWVATLGAGGAWFHAREAREQAREEQARTMSAEISRLASAVEARETREAQPAPAPSVVIDTQALDAFARAAAARADATRAQRAQDERPDEAKRAPAARSPEQTAAIDDAKRVLAGSFERGRITRDDSLAMRHDLVGASPEDALEVRRQIAVALNTDRLVPEERPFLLP